MAQSSTAASAAPPPHLPVSILFSSEQPADVLHKATKVVAFLAAAIGTEWEIRPRPEELEGLFYILADVEKAMVYSKAFLQQA